MNCKNIWLPDTIDNYITKTFRNVTLKNHFELVLFEREKGLLPASQQEVVRVLKIREYSTKIRNLKEQIKNLRDELSTYEIELLILERRSPKMTEKRVFTLHCSIDNCRGFIDNSNWKCGICSVAVCKECHVVIQDGQDHTCKQEDLDTVNMIKKETRSCPSCSTLIFKISGCSQMWCTQCHTTFCWNTGAIAKDQTHNPHYYEWLNANPNRNANQPMRNVGDVPCGGIILVNTLNSINRTYLKHCDSVFIDRMFMLHRAWIHIEQVCLPMYRTDIATDNLSLRVKFLLNEITEDQFKVLLQKDAKKRAKNKEIFEVIQMYLFTIVDMFNNLQETVTTNKNNFDLKEWFEHVKQLQDFANTQFEKISCRYNCVAPFISTNSGELSQKNYKIKTRSNITIT
jgi:hypothetical protein